MAFEFEITGDITKTRRIGHYVKVVGSDDQEYEITVNHQQGGSNYFTYKTEARGFYLSVTPVERSDNWVSFTGFSGNKLLLEQNQRFNRKRLNELVAEIFEDLGNNEKVIKVLEHVMRKNGKAYPSAEKATV
jgi:hypothetical protein